MSCSIDILGDEAIEPLGKLSSIATLLAILSILLMVE